jgi:hypothetical protein
MASEKRTECGRKILEQSVCSMKNLFSQLLIRNHLDLY